MKVCVPVAARPNLIKLFPVIRVLEEKGHEPIIVHTGQHYSYHMDRVFFEELGLAFPVVNLSVGSGSHAEQTGKALIGLEKVFQQVVPDVVLVHGDTNMVPAACLAAKKLGFLTIHKEAGLRSYDRNMPEEINRVVADHISDYLFAPTKTSYNTLISEGIPESRVFLTGNTVVDAINHMMKASERSQVLSRVGVEPRNYFLLTLHRPENVDNPTRLKNVLLAIKELSTQWDVLFPIHPRTLKRVEEYGFYGIFDASPHLKVLDPLGYADFLCLERNASLILTDSGGVQEEACILGVPCVTLRDNTERPETVEVGANILSGVDKESVLGAVRKQLGRRGGWGNPFGDGHAGERIVGIMEELVGF